jgi:hypothetical protein
VGGLLIGNLNWMNEGPPPQPAALEMRLRH